LRFWRRQRRWNSEPAQFREQVLALRYGSGLVDLGPPHDALSVDEERRALIHAALVVENAVRFADRAVRPVVREKRERNAAQVLGPPFQARNGIGADLQDFDVQFLEFFEVRTEPGDLILSAAGECEGKKRDDRKTPAVIG
jgi:hypothetical protein